jgi:tetratricopeptide (TPR) repeat protein
MRIINILLFLLLTAAPAAAQSFEAVIARGDSAQAAMDIDAALRFYRQAERLAPARADVLWRLSQLHTEMAAGEEDEGRAKKLLDRSLRYADRASEVAPRSAMVQVSYAIAYGQLSLIAPNDDKLDLSKKIREYAMRALELDARNSVAMLVLGIWHREVASLNWALKLLLDAVYGGLPDASLEESHRLLSSAVKLKPGQIMPRLELAKTLIAMDREREARQQLRKAVSLPLGALGDDERVREARELLEEL